MIIDFSPPMRYATNGKTTMAACESDVLLPYPVTGKGFVCSLDGSQVSVYISQNGYSLLFPECVVCRFLLRETTLAGSGKFHPSIGYPSSLILLRFDSVASIV